MNSGKAFAAALAPTMAKAADSMRRFHVTLTDVLMYELMAAERARELEEHKAGYEAACARLDDVEQRIERFKDGL